jgi:hypothetical protein
MREHTVTLTLMVPDGVPTDAVVEIVTNALPDTLDAGVAVLSVED